MTKKQRTNRKHSGIISWLRERIFHRAASEHESDVEEKLKIERIQGPIYEMGCSASAGAIISKGLDQGDNYPSSDTEN